MHAQPKKRAVVENGGDGGIGPGLAAAIANGEDVGPIVRHVFESGKPEALLHHLRNIVKNKESEIEELCKLHYGEFILAVDELKGVLVDADNLKSQLILENSRLQDASVSLFAKIIELTDLYSVRSNVAEAILALKVCVHVTSLCLSCSCDVSEGRFYPALKTLDIIQKDYLHSIPVKTLRRVISKQLPAIKLHIEKKICGEFNDWLVYIRTTAREIGQLSIRQTATSRQRDEEMRSRQREAEEQSRTGSTAFNEYVYSLDSTEQAEEDVVLDFNLTSVHRAYHIYSCLGIGEKFRDYYHKNRLMQLQLDLQVSTMQPFLESHQPFLAQVAGFFIVEDRVLRSAGGLLTEEQVESTWDTAIAKITAILEDQFARLDTASHLLLIKDYVSLLGATLKRYGYRVGPLMDILDKSRDKYHELLLTECRKQISDILINDSYEQMVLKKEYEYNMNVLSFNLQAMDMIPDFPYVAPFSSSVPDVCRVIRSFIEDSVSYLSYGGGFIVNSYEVVKKYLDKLLIEVLNNSLLNIIHGGAFGVPQAMQIGSNISVFERACDSFFLWQAGQLCGIPKRIVERPHSGLTAKAVLKASQNVAYNKLLYLVNDKLDSIMGQMSNINWTAEEVSEHANDYMNEVLVYLDSVVSAAQQILPLEALYKVAIGALGHVSDYIMTAFLSDSLKRFNVNAVAGIDNDLKLLESFADDRYDSTGVKKIGNEATFTDCLVEVRQLVNLLLSNQPENFINPVIRVKNYGALDHKKVAIICEKYKDAPDRLFGSLSNRNTKQSVRKKSMDVLKRRLKDMS
ncbi:exocyst complex component SEC15A-like protein [Carex littledalei]|uniref:Exocyst complex component n=1 Tax=Carex littledalei TaxID=544730 RepID=A0A833QH11_9POAL|nr:exocyst complex component SEC15A-like protein [Carex littledalei]